MRKGFTLLEALVAIYVLLFGIMSAVTLVQRSLPTAAIFRERLVASNLAQEGIELVRAKQISNILELDSNQNLCVLKDVDDPCDPSGVSLNQIDVDDIDPMEDGPCASSAGCYVDWQNISDITDRNHPLTFLDCNGAPGGICPPVHFDEMTGLFYYDTSLPETLFTRTIIVNRDTTRRDNLGPEPPDTIPAYHELKVISRVTWESRFGGDKSVELATYLSPY